MNQLNGVKQALPPRSIRFAIAALALVTLATVASAQQFTIGPYHLQQSTRVSLTQYDYTYTADVTNPGALALSLTGTVTSSSPTTIVTRGTVNFGLVPAGGTITSIDTFTIRQDRTTPFDPASLAWTFSTTQKPTANAGVNQFLYVNQQTRLDGTGSTDPNGLPLTYSWTVVSAPANGYPSINNHNDPIADFDYFADGLYTIQLVVNNGISDSDPAIIKISSTQLPPNADAGPDQLAPVGSAAQLDGSRSVDGVGVPITYAWSILSAPGGSTASLSSSTIPRPSFTPDVPGQYVFQLIVSNQYFSSTPSKVTLSTAHIPPVANAGTGQVVPYGAAVTLDGTRSTDANGLPLTYSWSFVGVPKGGSATLSDPTSPHPSFTLDSYGLYVAQLIVKDGLGTSAPATVAIVATGVIPLAPIANPGPEQTIPAGQSVAYLDGSGSTDPNNLPLTYAWHLLYQPTSGGLTQFGNPTSSTAPLAIYSAGTYIVELIVRNNNAFPSRPSTAVIDGNGMNSLVLDNLGVGNNSITGFLLRTSQPLLGGGTATITSNDPTHFLLGTSSNQIGAPAVTVSMSGLPPVITIEGQNFSGSGPITATYTASAPGFTSATSTLTLVPTGWYLNTPAPLTTTLFAGPLTLGPYFSALDPVTLAGPSLYSGHPPDTILGPQAGPFSILTTSSNPAVGTVSGAGPNQSIVFQPLSLGTTVVTMTEPPGYSTPSNEPLQTTITVTNPFIEAYSADSLVANNSITKGVIYLGAPALADETITVTSTDPTHILLSTSPTVVGTASITLPLAAGTSNGNGPTFYIQGQNFSGNKDIFVNLIASAPNYLSAPASVTLFPSAFVIVGSHTLSLPITSPDLLTVALTPLFSSTLTTYIDYVPLGPQAPAASVGISSSNPSVATIYGSPATITPGNSENTSLIAFIPNITGTTTLTVIQPPGYFTPSDASDQLVITISP